MSFRTSGPSAKIADGRLILTLPDAETPALWMMDLNDAATSVIRLETDSKGFYILKKHGAKGQPETIAVYRDRERAANALDKTSKTLEKARTGYRGASGGDGFSRRGRIFIYCVLTWMLMFMFNIDRVIISLLAWPVRIIAANHMPGVVPSVVPNTLPQSQNAAPPAGVPMSADQFLTRSGVDSTEPETQ